MNVSELFALTKWINSEINAKQVSEKYQALHTILQQNSQPNQPKQPFEDQKNSLIETLSAVDLSALSTHQLAFLDSLNISSAIGEEGVAAIEDILYKNVIDIATSVTDIGAIISRIQNAIQKSSQIQTGIAGCVDEEKIAAEGALIRITFSGNAAMANITDMKKWGDKWYEIGRGITMAHGLAPEDIRVVGATTGSIVIELATAYAIVKTTSAIIMEVLKVADKVLEIRKKVEEIRAFKFANKDAENALMSNAQSEHDNGIKNITKKFVTELKLSKGNNGDKVTNLEKAVKDLVEFIENGGEVDFIPPEDENAEEMNETDAADQKKLRSQFNEIRRLEKKIHAIEYLDADA